MKLSLQLCATILHLGICKCLLPYIRTYCTYMEALLMLQWWCMLSVWIRTLECLCICKCKPPLMLANASIYCSLFTVSRSSSIGHDLHVAKPTNVYMATLIMCECVMMMMMMMMNSASCANCFCTMRPRTIIYILAYL